MTTTNPEVDALDPDPSELTLETGERIVVQRLRTRQMFRLLKILTTGAGSALTTLDLSGDESQFIAELIGITVVSIPNAEDEAVDFIISMVDSADVIERPRTKGDRERNAELRENLAASLNNPSLEDLISIIEVIIRKEAPEIMALGKRLGALISTSVTAPEPVEEKPSRSSRRSSKD